MLHLTDERALAHRRGMNDAIRRAAAILRAANDPAVDGIADWLTLGARGDLRAFLGETEHRRHDIDARNRLLRDAARSLFGNATRADQARRLQKALTDYSEHAWRIDCIETQNPNAPGSLVALCWEVLRLRDHVPSLRQLKRILTER
jgi:hypothetical protein